MMKICTNCKHSYSPGISGLVYCKHPLVGISPVDGKVKPTWAHAQRAEQTVYNSNTTCGPNGDWYDEKYPVGASNGWWNIIRKRFGVE